MKFSVIVLAAGTSSRLGRSKQLLPYGENTLVRHSVEQAIGSRAYRVIVVLGKDAEEVRQAVGGLDVDFVVNELFAEGMGTSISAGMKAVSDDVECVVLTLCDQPLVTSAHLWALVRGIDDRHPIAASAYEGVLGVPAAFARSQFPLLASCRGDAGSRDFIRSHPDLVSAVPFPGAACDVDALLGG